MSSILCHCEKYGLKNRYAAQYQTHSEIALRFDDWGPRKGAKLLCGVKSRVGYVQGIPFLDAVGTEPALLHLDRVLKRPERHVHGGGIERLHLADAHDFAPEVYEGDGKRYPCILHPERVYGFLGKNEKHAVVREKGVPKHKTLTP